MISVSAPTNKTQKPAYLLAVGGLVVALSLGLAIGWQIGGHRAGSGQIITHSEEAVVPRINGPTAGAAPGTDTAVSTASLPAVAARGGAAEAIADATTAASDSLPASIVTIYLVETPADAARLQDVVDEASRVGDLSGGSAWILVAGTQGDALSASAAIDEATSRYGTDRVQVMDLRTTVAAR